MPRCGRSAADRRPAWTRRAARCARAAQRALRPGGDGAGGGRRARAGRRLPARLAAVGGRAGARGGRAAADALCGPDILTPYGLRTWPRPTRTSARRLPPRCRLAVRLVARLGRSARVRARGGGGTGADGRARRARRAGPRARALRGRADGSLAPIPLSNRVQAWTIGARWALEHGWDGPGRDTYPQLSLSLKGVPPFKLDAVYSPDADQPNAIETLAGGIERGDSGLTLRAPPQRQDDDDGGGDQGRPAPGADHRPDKTLAAQLCNEFRTYFPTNCRVFRLLLDYYQPEAYVPSRDLYIEKDSAINQRSTGCAMRPRPPCSPVATSSSSPGSRASSASARPSPTTGTTR